MNPSPSLKAKRGQSDIGTGLRLVEATREVDGVV